MGFIVLAIAGYVLYSIHQNNQMKQQPIRIEKERNDPRRR